MPATSFETACDRLSHVVDSVQFERVRWARHEGPMFARLVELAQAAVAERPDFELADEGSSGGAKRFVLKVHGKRIVALNIALEAGQAALWCDAIERSPYRVVNGRRHVADFQAIDAEWMQQALGAIWSEVE